MAQNFGAELARSDRQDANGIEKAFGQFIADRREDFLLPK